MLFEQGGPVIHQMRHNMLYTSFQHAMTRNHSPALTGGSELQRANDGVETNCLVLLTVDSPQMKMVYSLQRTYAMRLQGTTP